MAIVVDVHTYSMTPQQHNAVIGSLLGDGSLGSLGYGRRNSYFTKSQKLAAKEYLLSLHDLLAPHSKEVREQMMATGYGAGKRRVVFKTGVNPYFTALRKEWYPGNKKCVPESLKLNPEILAWWFCDDGTNTWRSRRATFYTQGFSKSDNDLLAAKLNELGIAAYVGKTYDDTGSGLCIDIGGNSYCDLLDMIRPHVPWKCMRYKVDAHGALKGLRRGNKSGINGVYWDKTRSKWSATIKLNGKSVSLGRFLSIEEAIVAREKAEEKKNAVPP